jgi:AAA domain
MLEDSIPYGEEEAAERADQDRRASSNGQSPPQRHLLFTPASNITPRPVRWVWDTTPAGGRPTEQGRFPAGSLVLAVGRAGLGKSQFAVWMAAQITRGVLLGCHYGTPRSVVYCATEDSWEMTIVPRLMAAGADLDRVFHVRAVDDGDPHARLTLPEDTRLLEAGIGEHDVALVVLDPLLSLLDHEINDYRAREVRHALEPVVAVADRTHCLFLGLAHFTKATGSDPLMLVSGSGAFGQLIRAGVGFARDEEADGEALVLSQIKNNLGREDLPSLKYEIQPASIETPEGTSYVSKFRFTGEESERSVRDLLRGEVPDGRTERDEAAEWLTAYLTVRGGEAPRRDLLKDAKAEGFSEATLKRAMRKAGVEAERSGFQGGSTWKLQPQSDRHSGHSDHTFERELNGPNEGRMEPADSHSAQSAHTLGGEPAEPNARRLDGVWRCNRCGHETTYRTVASYQHTNCGGLFQAAETA